MKTDPLKQDRSPEAIDAACLMLGKFFFNWAALESAIDTVVQKLFGLDNSLRMILSANLNFSSKLYIIETTLLWQGRGHDEAWRKRASKLCARIGRLNRSRNLMAHNLFVPLQNKSVRFYKIEARGTLDVPDIRWSPKDFERTYQLLNAAGTELKKLTEEMKNRQAIVTALMAAPAPNSLGGPPTGSIANLGLLGSLFRQTQSPPDSQTGQAKPETGLQTLPAPQPKPEP